ncbi:MAG TPA: Re/Si-specific NAD(P)(+) transhydrogenase subunit alpha [Myxococcota bacterium]|nr:Re/Si-specific NAD(P)(+) transhydrogenase subunit alpha [Myxococcota bacterium]
MILAVPKETWPGERRVALVPDSVKALAKAGIEVAVETGAGASAGFEDDSYVRAGATVASDATLLLGRADLVVKVQPPRVLEHGGHEIDLMREGATLVGLLRPLDMPGVARHLAARRITAFALELIPRITRAQSMDVLSSMATIAGYHAVLLGAQVLPKIFPMLVTAAGTISPARVLVVGAGVAGLQAIATARRLGAVVEAYDTRPAVKEQVQSLGARFVELLLETGDAEDSGGYAKAQSEEFYARQRALLGDRVRAADVIITTAQVPGQRAPLLIDEDTVRGMRPGSVIVDLAAEQGGNCALTQAGRDIVAHGVQVRGPLNLPSAHATHASQLFARNVATFVLHLVKEGKLVLDLEDELTRAPLVTREGRVEHEGTRTRLEELAGGGGT